MASGSQTEKIKNYYKAATTEAGKRAYNMSRRKS